MPRIGISRAQAAVAAPIAVFNLGFDFAAPFLPFLVTEIGVRDLGEAALWSGIFLGITPLLASLTSPFWGRLADRYGAKLMMLRVLVMFGVFLALTGLVTSLAQLLVVRVATGLMGGITPIAITLAVRSSPSGQSGRAVGLIQSATYLPLVVGPAVGGLLLDAWGVRANFVAAGAVSLVAAAVLWLALPGDDAAAQRSSRAVADEDGDPEPPRSARDRPAGGPGGVPRASVLFLPVFVLLIAQLVDRAFNPVIPLMVQDVGVDADSIGRVAGLTVGAGAAGIVISSTVVGRLVERRSPELFVAVGLLAGSLLCVPIMFVSDASQLLVLRTAVALTAGSVPTLAYAIAANSVPRAVLGRTMGYMASAALMANAIGPAVGGVLASRDLRFVFPVLSLLLLVALVVFGAARRQLPASRRDGPPGLAPPS